MRASLVERILAGVVLCVLAVVLFSPGHNFRLHFNLSGAVQLRRQPGVDRRVVVLRDARGHQWVSQVDIRGYFFLSGWRPRLPAALFVCDLADPNDSTRTGFAVQGTDWVRAGLRFDPPDRAATCRDLAT